MATKTCLNFVLAHSKRYKLNGMTATAEYFKTDLSTWQKLGRITTSVLNIKTNHYHQERDIGGRSVDN